MCKRLALTTAICAATVWQTTGAVADAVRTAPTAAWSQDPDPLLHQLERVRIRQKGRLEVVPASSPRESSALPEHAHLARGWNRQADLGRNPVFYDGTLTARSYRAWLDRWAVHYVVLPSGPLDSAGSQEAELIRQGLPYLKQIWSDANWKLSAVQEPTPLAGPDAGLADAAHDRLTVTVHRAGPVRLRVPYSPWLALVDSRGHKLKQTWLVWCRRPAGRSHTGRRTRRSEAARSRRWRREGVSGRSAGSQWSARSLTARRAVGCGAVADDAQGWAFRGGAGRSHAASAAVPGPHPVPSR
ncbi:hypothetical protein [Streptomyces sp. AC602_WCS936]|uniref:hypothetical protein n=1 Tax=Streptomyces sp. AC602_WCS936 TaxID=2823685 RepID=UPI001C252740|nr:hypothetical protein [Streptomyces sp. AC602_WCS936]